MADESEPVKTAVTYPVDAVTPNDKIEYGYAAQEALRLEHNAKGADFKNGIITQKEWADYLLIFDEKQLLISKSILVEREILKQSTKWVVDLENL